MGQQSKILNTNLGVVVPAHNDSIQKAEEGGFQFWLHSETMSPKNIY
jgi:hypothetical protein